MGLTINTNDVSLAAQRHLGVTDQRFKQTVQRLSSGTRIVSASDDPAGLAISDHLEANIRSLGAAVRNVQDGISLIQVFEGGTTQINNMLVRVRELSMQSASDTIGDTERHMLDNEVQQLKDEITRIANTTVYAGRNLLCGEGNGIQLQVGVNNNPEVDRIEFNPGDTDMRASALGVEGVDVNSKEAARENLDVLDEALLKVNDIRARVGSAQSRLQTTIAAQLVMTENLTAAKSRILDADMAKETANLARDTILRQAGVAVLSQANTTPALALSLLTGR